MREFHNDFVKDKPKIWAEVLKHLVGKQITALEIGCHEGGSTCWWLENILTHPESIMVHRSLAGRTWTRGVLQSKYSRYRSLL
jgi:hypothetical protein